MISTCPRCGAQLDYEKDGYQLSHAMGMVEPDIYDGVLFWQCPFCGGRWHHWEPGTYPYRRAQEYVNE